MSKPYAKHFNQTKTPQSEPMSTDQIKNSAGGFVWKADEWTRLDRFLVLGTEGNTYYATEKSITRENANHVISLIKKDGVRVVNRITEISDAGRAYKNDAALFALALAFGEGNAETRTAAITALPKIARTGTHLFTFVEFITASGVRGWGRGLRRAVASWYTEKSQKDLAYQVTKYQQRNGWSHSDMLWLSHAKAGNNPVIRRVLNRDGGTREVCRYTKPVNGERDVISKHKYAEAGPVPEYMDAAEEMKTADAKRSHNLILKYDLPREVVRTELLNDPRIWEALLIKMPPTALIRNLATMTRVGVLKPLSKWNNIVCERLTDKALLNKKRIHPLQILAALLTYKSGKGDRGNNTWNPVQQIVDALDQAFYLTFDTAEPTGKRLVLAIDVSGSMDGGVVGGVSGLTPRIASAVLALVTASVEKNYTIVGFSAGSGGGFGGQWGGGDPGLSNIPISPRQRLDSVVKVMQGIPMGGTDCSLPMRWAEKKELEVDGFVILTDNETWAGPVHAAQALKNYRKASGIPAKLVVVSMIPNEFSLADPNDIGMLDCVGMSTDTPVVISDFIRN